MMSLKKFSVFLLFCSLILFLGLLIVDVTSTDVEGVVTYDSDSFILLQLEDGESLQNIRTLVCLRIFPCFKTDLLFFGYRPVFGDHVQVKRFDVRFKWQEPIITNPILSIAFSKQLESIESPYTEGLEPDGFPPNPEQGHRVIYKSVTVDCNGWKVVMAGERGIDLLVEGPSAGTWSDDLEMERVSHAVKVTWPDGFSEEVIYFIREPEACLWTFDVYVRRSPDEDWDKIGSFIARDLEDAFEQSERLRSSYGFSVENFCSINQTAIRRYGEEKALRLLCDTDL
jgi:hypothetical protein